MIDNKGIIESVNKSALVLFGYTEEELIGRNVSVLMPEPYEREHDAYLERYNKTREPQIIGIGREVEGKTKAGHIFPLRLAVSEVILNDREKQKMLYKFFVSLGTLLLLKIRSEHDHSYPGLEDHNPDHDLTGFPSNVVAIAAVFSKHNFEWDEVLADPKDRILFRDLNQGCFGYETIKFFHKRSSCKCLNEQYTRAKTSPKLMVCNYCKKKKDRRQLFMCGRCKYTHYCSVECQAADYADHKTLCGMLCTK